jgi:murein DD-endopeptidase MepM/ murein hydrolase activator NlpD
VSFTLPQSQKSVSKVIPGRSRETILESKKSLPKTSFRWLLGDPNANVQDYFYHAPFQTKKSYRITQSFNGKATHNTEGSRFAVDIAMDVGTHLTAARSGTVVMVKDSYHMSGRTQYFLDKANVIKVLHDDGSFALYAHILLDTAVVKVGDKVVVGDRLARSGSSGFSTGPHLHFVIIKNTGLKSKSIPFKFINHDGVAYVPKQGMTIVGARKAH